MAESFGQATSNGRRGRHAAPAESARLDHPGDYPGDYLGGTDHETPGDEPARRANGHRVADEPYGGGHRDRTEHDHNGNGVAVPYAGYGLPAEWTRPRGEVSPASTQPSLTTPDWDEPSLPTALPSIALPAALLPPTEPDWRSPPSEPDWRNGGTPDPSPAAPPGDHHGNGNLPETYHRPGLTAPAETGRELPAATHYATPAVWSEVPGGGDTSRGTHRDTRRGSGDAEDGATQRLAGLADAVGELAAGCRSLAHDLRSAGGARHGDVANLLSQAADGADGVRHLLDAARQSLAGDGWSGSARHAQPARHDPAERAAVERSVDHVVVPDPAGRNGSGPGSPHTVPHPREAMMPPELPSTAPSYPPVLPLGLRDGAQAAVVARQVEAARRHLLAALTVGHDVNDPAWRQQLLGMVEQVLSAVAEVASLARDALAPSATDTTFPGEARFLCALPWEHVPVASPERSDLPASVNGVARLLSSLGYEARASRTEQGGLQVEVRGARYAVRIALQQLRLSGAGEWMAYLDWTDGTGHPRSGAETLGPAELSDEELARRVDDALRRRVGTASG